jgi:hypothetical protein
VVAEGDRLEVSSGGGGVPVLGLGGVDGDGYAENEKDADEGGDDEYSGWGGACWGGTLVVF